MNKNITPKIVHIDQRTFTCICGLLNHAMQVTYFKEDGSIYIEQMYSYHRPWYSRIWNAIKYVFGNKHLYLTETELMGKELKEFIKFIDSVKGDIKCQKKKTKTS